MEKYSGSSLEESVSKETHVSSETQTQTLKKRLEKVWDWMAKEGIALIMLEDTESMRDQNICWLTGHPNDALLFLSVDRNALLVAWDINLAKIYACNSSAAVASYNDFDRTPLKALTAAAKKMGIPSGSKIEIPSVTPYPAFLNYVGELTDYDIICREKSAALEIKKMRAVKDDEEISIIKKAAVFTNEIINLLEKNVRTGKIKTETDAAMFIQIEALKRGCEGISFETLAAGPERSYAIHAFPSSTSSPFGAQGLSILDFGLKYKGYCTDVTLTFTRNINSKQEKLVSLVEKASKLAIPMSRNGAQARDIAYAVDVLFKKYKKEMPHGLGHGVGLQEHEFPVIRNSSNNDWILEPGMIFTIEPGLYDPVLGGCRLENDILITENGYEILTGARIINL